MSVDHLAGEFAGADGIVSGIVAVHVSVDHLAGEFAGYTTPSSVT